MKKARALPAHDSSSATPLLALGLISLGAAVYHRSAACAALGVVLLAMPGIVFVLLRRSLGGLAVERHAPESAFAGDRVTVRLSVRNGSRLPLFLPRVTDVFPPDVHDLKQVLFPFRVLPGETLEQTYRAECDLPRGVYTLGPTVATLTDPFGWFQARKVVHDERPFKVYPQYQDFGAKEEGGASMSPVFEDLARSLLGDSSEFIAVREYRIGDPLRRVHWGLTAHRGFPVVREFAHNTVGDLCIFIDLFRFALLGIGRGSSLEQSVKITVSIASHALGKGFRVEVAAKSKTSSGVPSGSGKGHLQPILDGLVSVRPDGETPLHEVIGERAQSMPTGSRVMIPVSPYLRESEAFELQLQALRQRGVRVILVVFDDATFKSLYESPRGAPSVDSYLARLRAVGFEAYRVPCGADLPLVFSSPCEIGGALA